MSVCIAGASGFIGHHLSQRLQKEGYRVSSISRRDFSEGGIPAKMADCEIVVNLVGETIAGFWTKGKRKKIYESRIFTTRKLVEAINVTGNTVKLLVQVSGVGVYDGKHVHEENSDQFDNGFLSQVILDWEGELDKIRTAGLRIVVLRLGVVLDGSGALLKKIMTPFKWGVGFGIKSDYFFPFIHLHDLMDIFLFVFNKPGVKGIVNGVVPVIPTIIEFYREMATAFNSRFIIWLRRSFIMLVMGDSGSLLCKGQKVVPSKLLGEGFVFKYKNIEDALNSACN